MSDPFLAEIKIVPYNFAPRGWAMCNGQVLPINQNQPLFALMGTTYGGNGQTTFALPDLRGRIPVFATNNSTQLGERSGEENHTLQIAEIPAHTHQMSAVNSIASQSNPTNNYFPNDPVLIEYANSAGSSMATTALQFVGGSQPHSNMPPYLVLNFVIALVGIFPPYN